MGLLDEYASDSAPKRKVYDDNSIMGDYVNEGLNKAEAKLRHGERLAHADRRRHGQGPQGPQALSARAPTAQPALIRSTPPDAYGPGGRHFDAPGSGAREAHVRGQQPPLRHDRPAALARVGAHAPHARRDDRRRTRLDGAARLRVQGRVRRRQDQLGELGREHHDRRRHRRGAGHDRQHGRPREARQPARRGHAAQHPRRRAAGEEPLRAADLEARSAASRPPPRSTCPTRSSPRPRRC